MNRPAPIDVEHLSLAFGGRTVLRDFSLRVATREKVVLAGASGSGKSSVLACLLGFVAPAAGRIVRPGRSDLPQIRLAPAPSWPSSSRSRISASNPSGSGSRSRFLSSANAGAAAASRALPDLLGAPAPGARPSWRRRAPISPAAKSSGVALVAALLLDRPILLLDEPTSALDPDSRQAVYACLAGLQNRPMLMVSHDTGPALDFADRTVRLPGRRPPMGAIDIGYAGLAACYLLLLLPLGAMLWLRSP
jgi:energy-coupling factor transporter ATP-binding protein EcfA2